MGQVSKETRGHEPESKEGRLRRGQRSRAGKSSADGVGRNGPFEKSHRRARTGEKALDARGREWRNGYWAGEGGTTWKLGRKKGKGKSLLYPADRTKGGGLSCWFDVDKNAQQRTWGGGRKRPVGEMRCGRNPSKDRK